MLFFSASDETTSRFVLVLDVGSGTIGAVLIDTSVASNQARACVWSKRIQMTLKSSDINRKFQHVKSALMEMILLVNKEGTEALRMIDEHARIGQVFVHICSPWTQTVAQKVSYTKDHPFTTSKALLQELATEVQKEALEKANNEFAKNGKKLSVLESEISNIEINGYRLPSIIETETRQLHFTHYTSFLSEDMSIVIDELLREAFVTATVTKRAYMPMFVENVIAMREEVDFALLDITHEGTELALVRENTVTNVGAVPYGIATLAHAIAEGTDSPNETGFQMLRQENPHEVPMSKKKTERVEMVITEYEEALLKLLHESEDTLLARPTIITHCDKAYEPFFTARVKNAFKRQGILIQNMQHVSITEQIAQVLPYECDSALALSVYDVMQYSNPTYLESTKEEFTVPAD